MSENLIILQPIGAPRAGRIDAVQDMRRGRVMIHGGPKTRTVLWNLWQEEITG